MSDEITAVGPDGRRHIFPAGTRQEVIDGVMRRTYGQPTRQATAAAARAVTPEGRPRRSLWDRFTDNAEDVWQTSVLAESFRAGRVEGAQQTNGEVSFDELRRRDGLIGNPIRQLGRAVGAAQEALGNSDADEDVVNERARRDELARVNDRQRGNDSFLSYAREGEVGGTLAAGSVALLGTLAGAAADPVSYVTAGRGIITRAFTQATLAGGTDLVAQGAGVDAGIEERINYARTALSAAVGGLFSPLADLATAPRGRIAERLLTQPEAHAAPELEVGDRLMVPALSTADIAPTPPRIADEGIEVTDLTSGQTFDVPRVPRGSPEGGPEGPRAQAPEDNPQGPSSDRGGASDPLPTVSSPEARTGDGAAGWEDVDWGARRSPERAAAAMRHLDGLRKWIKPEAVSAFLRALDNGIEPAAEGVHINERWVDWDSMGGDPEGILGLTNAMADVFSDVYAKAGDARQGWEQTAKIADQMDFTLSDLIKTHADITGEGGLTARAGALRDTALASDAAAYEQFVTLRDAIGKGDFTGVSAFAETLHRTIILSAMDAGSASEIARAQQYRQRKGKPKFAKNDLQAAVDEINDLLNKGGDLDANGISKVVDELAKAYEKGGSAGMRQAVKQMRELGFWDYANYYATASLLSAPVTHIRNAFGTPIHALFQIGERYVAAGIGAGRRSAGLGSAERVTFREATAYASSVLQGWSEGLSLAGAAFRRGGPITSLRSSVMADEMAAQVPFQFSRERWEGWRGKPLSPRTWADATGVALFELQRTLGFRVSVATDELYKALGRRMQVNALAYREAAYRSALAGPEGADRVFADTLRALQDEPSAAAFVEAKAFFGTTGQDRAGVYASGTREEEMALILRSIDHRQMAVDHAQLLTFQNAGPIVEKWDSALRAVPILKSLFVNFVRTPVAILKAGIVDRNPVVGSAVALGELTTRAGRDKHAALFKALASEEKALARGGAEADLVLARQALGAATLTSIWMLWAGGNVIGKQSQQERENSGVADYSFRLPDGRWVQYTGMSPAGEMIGLVADTAAGLRRVDADDNAMFATVGAVAAAVRNNVVNKSFLKGVADFMELATGGQYGAGGQVDSGEGIGKALAEAAVPRVIPGGALLRRAAQDMDPVIRDARSFTEMVFAGLPLLSETVAARRDFMGRALVREPGERGVFQAFNVTSPTDDPLERELANLATTLGEQFQIGATPRQMNGQDLDTGEYSRLLEVQGQLLRMQGRNMEEALRELIQSPEYQGGFPEGRAYQIKRTISRYREAGNSAVRNPRSEFYMAEPAKRTGLRRLETETRQRGWSRGQAMGRARSWGMELDDPDIVELRDALFPEE